MEKRAQSQIMTSVLIILIVLIAVAIVWNFVLPLVGEKSENVDADSITTTLEVEDVVLFTTGASFVTAFFICDWLRASFISAGETPLC